MPQVFKVGSFWVYFWSNESERLSLFMSMFPNVLLQKTEQRSGLHQAKAYLCHNKSQIPSVALRNIMRILEARSSYIIDKWKEYFGTVSYFC